MVKGEVIGNFGNEYVVFLDFDGQSLFAGLTDGSVRQVDAATGAQKVVSTAGEPLVGVRAVDNRISTATTSGKIYHWDPRQDKQLLLADAQLPLASMNQKGTELAVGTELVKPDAGVLLYDIRKGPSPVVKYMESHNDDVTDIQFHPVHANTLLTGSTDGIVNIYNTSITDEDDAVYQTINHGASIHRTGFIADRRVFALSHMETLAVYEVSDPDETVEEPRPKDFGDLRDAWNCEYVTDYSRNHFLTGSNSEGWLKLVPFLNETAGRPVELDGGHGEEVARCFTWIDDKRIVTGGEDGIVKLWTLHEAAELPPKTGKSKDKSKSKDKEDKTKKKHKSKSKSHKPY